MKDTINTVQSVDRTINIIEVLSNHRDGLGLTELSQIIGLHKSTVHRLLLTLISHGYVSQNPQNQQYHMTIKMYELGSRVIDSMDLSKVSRPYLKALRDATNEVVHLVIPDGTDIVYIDKMESNNSIRMHSRIGARSPLYSTSAGKAMLAYLPESRIREIWDASDIIQRTPNTVVKYDQLLVVLEKVRENGYALDEEENEPGIRCIGAPIFNHKGDVIGAISISGPTMRVTPEVVETFKEHILKYTRLISQELGYRT
ncbi:MAG: IclR family transcriptional regulator [Dethiosulfatibacter sp.]|nr:IclR family transcriptional regulator [Dethiosulfatibacter sp.]